MTPHVLDRPTWSALTDTHAQFAIGTGGARRYRADVSILTGLRDNSAEALADLGALVPETGEIIVTQTWAVGCPEGARITSVSPVYQLVYAGGADGPPKSAEIIALTEADWPEMLALATATRPGPFTTRTPVLGTFWGVKRDGRLIAMAGERMRQGPYAEVSGICTDPAHRGQGLGEALCIKVRNCVLARGETPYLHAYATNVGALKLYRRLGFQKRTELIVTVMEKDA